MSTIKSSDEHLTLNADGSSKDIKFQANGVEKASISSAGAFTSTTIDATKLTGDLPAISGANLTGVGVAGITSTADGTAITINATENVGIEVTPESWENNYPALQIGGAGALSGHSSGEVYITDNVYRNGGNWKHINTGAATFYQAASGKHKFKVTPSGSADANISWTDALEITNDGRGVSQFTAHAWGKINGTGTPGLLTGHNVSSITDQSTGRYRANYTTNSNGANTVVISGQNNSYYDELYYLDVDESNSSKAAFGCSRSGTSAGWFDTYKMSFVTFAT